MTFVPSYALRTPRQFVAAAIVLVVVMPAISGCTLLPNNQLRVRRDLGAGFPGFQISKLESEENWPLLPADGGESSAFKFVLESDDVDGFTLEGRYRLAGAFSEDEQELTIRGSMFNRESLEAKDVIALERVWVGMRPSDEVSVGLDAATGTAARFIDMFAEMPQRDDLDPADVYCLESRGQFYFFHLDRQSGEWDYVPDFRQSGEF